jgi:hypothetical protein
MTNAQAIGDVDALLGALTVIGTWETPDLIAVHQTLRTLRETVAAVDQPRAAYALDRAVSIVERIIFGEAQGMPTWAPVLQQFAGVLKARLSRGETVIPEDIPPALSPEGEEAVVELHEAPQPEQRPAAAASEPMDVDDAAESAERAHLAVGQLMVDNDAISPSQLEIALRVQVAIGCQRRLGEILIDMGMADQPEVDQALEQQNALLEARRRRELVWAQELSDESEEEQPEEDCSEEGCEPKAQGGNRTRNALGGSVQVNGPSLEQVVDLSGELCVAVNIIQSSSVFRNRLGPEIQRHTQHLSAICDELKDGMDSLLASAHSAGEEPVAGESFSFDDVSAEAEAPREDAYTGSDPDADALRDDSRRPTNGVGDDAHGVHSPSDSSGADGHAPAAESVVAIELPQQQYRDSGQDGHKYNSLHALQASLSEAPAMARPSADTEAGQEEDVLLCLIGGRLWGVASSAVTDLFARISINDAVHDDAALLKYRQGGDAAVVDLRQMLETSPSDVCSYFVVVKVDAASRICLGVDHVLEVARVVMLSGGPDAAPPPWNKVCRGIAAGPSGGVYLLSLDPWSSKSSVRQWHPRNL